MASRSQDMRNTLVIFDCDGVIVDSEPISIAVLVRAVGSMGVEISLEDAYARFLGRSLSTISGILHAEYGLAIDEGFLARMRHDLYGRFRAELLPVSGIAETVDRLKIPYCLASSSQPERIRLCLGVTGLLERFEPHIFSATMVERGKPHPDLFLHAALQMQAHPKDCIVVEDSPAGVEAAHAAGMTVFAFAGGSHAQGKRHRDALLALRPHAMFDAMPDLIHLVEKHTGADYQNGTGTARDA